MAPQSQLLPTMKNSQYKKLMLIDGQAPSNDMSEAKFPETLVVYWSSFCADNHAISLSSYINAADDSLRDELMLQIDQLSDGLIDRLTLKGQISSWWLGRLSEKSIYKSPWLYDALRLVALKRHLSPSISSIQLLSSNSKLCKLIKLFSKENRILFSSVKHVAERPEKSKERASLVRRIYSCLPFFIKTPVFFFRYAFHYRCFSKGKHPRHIERKSINNKRITLVSYFPNMDLKAANEGAFYSYYWCDLPKVLNEMGYAIDWIFIYANSQQCSPQAALKVINTLNASDAINHYQFLHQPLCMKLLFSVILRYFRFSVKGICCYLRSFILKPSVRSSSIFFLSKSDLSSALFGDSLLDGCFFCEFIGATLKMLVNSMACIYLYESQSWERALIHQWRKNYSAPVIGFQHSSVRQYDFRYYNHVFEKKHQISPDFICCGGDDAIMKLNRCIDSGTNYLVPVESLRYNYLLSLERQAISKNGESLNIFIFTDYLLSPTRYQFNFFREFLCKYQESTCVTLYIKPHPFLAKVADLAAEYFPDIKYTLVFEHISKLSNKIDFAIVCQNSGASLDLLYMGIPTVSISDPGELNFSPVLGYKHLFVEEIDDLYEKISTRHLLKSYIDDNFSTDCDFYYLNNQLHRWKYLLNSLGADSLSAENKVASSLACY
jgi:surface carbohydrate biosynthesis protein (TIGR04326 family)